MTSDDFAALDAVEIASLVSTKAVSPVEVVEATLRRINSLDREINAFTEVFEEQARLDARKAEQRVGDGDGQSLPLLGVPVSIKDHIWVKGTRSTNGSRALEHFVAPEDCALVECLRSAGAIIVGKTNNPEFLYRSFTDNDVFGVTRNPWNLERTAGGSSGGAGAAIAAGMAPLSIGTDGGGSIRIPASFCGIVGLKPSFGLVPKVPGFRGWPTLSTNGPMSRSVRDIGLTLSVIAGMHGSDMLSFPHDRSDFTAYCRPDADLKGLRIAVSEDFSTEPVDDDVRHAFRAAVSKLASTGCTLVQADPPSGDRLQELWWRIMACEAYASEGDLLAEHASVMTDGTSEIIRSGERFTAKDYLDAQDERAALARRWAEFFNDYDLLVAPTLQVTAFPVGQTAPKTVGGRPCDPIFEDWVSMIYAANLVNCPSVSVPIGFSPAGLPIGMQIMAQRFNDSLTLRAGAAWEALQPWAQEWPASARM
jgi:Asp-tRNA(Asn)/Glu-tRNA(Gln) amidotransferase A subunit family amidase